MIDVQPDDEKINLQEWFSYRQIGAITTPVSPIDISFSVEVVLDLFKNNPDLPAIPIEQNGTLIGILNRSEVEKLTESAWARFWQKDLGAYIKEQLFFLRAEDYIEKNIEQVLKINAEKGVRFFAVFLRKSFFGIVGLRDMLMRITEVQRQDMSRARMVQQNLLEETSTKKDDRYTLITWNRMASEVGGDFYKDFCLPDGDRHIVGCFDVSGKNVAASLSTMAIGSFFTALDYFGITGEIFGEELTLKLDKYIEDLTPADMFITAALCYIDLKAGTVLIQNCGHTPIYIFIPDENNKIAGKTMKPNLPPLGMGLLEAQEKSSFCMPIKKGFRIVLYTDGLTDMVNSDGARFEEDRARELLVETYGKPEAETRAIYTKNIDSWMTEALQADDITIMDIRFK